MDYYYFVEVLSREYGAPMNYDNLKDNEGKWIINEKELKLALKEYGKETIIGCINVAYEEYLVKVNKKELLKFLNYET